ncbi:hypothetical protein SBRCBS47491_002280 [Sporothrix bragantina]|uniref:6-phosphogluconate dehydrogenase n=1 Tax=Sporothrix bragantina TaxID=671064 RepID=A0ABP0B6H8_9PEZI
MTLSALRPRLAAATAPRAAPRCVRYLSSTAVHRFTELTLPKQTVLDNIRVKQDVLIAQNKAAPQAQPDNAAVILASPEFATWLDDEAFVAALLQHMPLSHPQSNGNAGTSVLCAVVAALATPQTAAKIGQTPVSGLSIAYGNTDVLLPGLWHGEGNKETLRSSRGSIGSDLDRDAAITVEVPPLSGANQTGDGSLRVTLPLSNTIFQNGRRSTLLASLWKHGGPEGQLERQNVESREHQLVVVPPVASTTATVTGNTQVSAPLFALSEPLKIASGLGNIVRQVFDPSTGRPIPAARELETDIPALLAARRKATPGLEDGALAVWGLVIPEKAMPFYEQLRLGLSSPGETALHALASDADHAPEAEQQVATRTSAHFTALLAAGCRLHRILSGGGGWGLKQGLLSLDPQMSHPASASLAASQSADAASQPKILGEERRDEEMDDEAMLSFIRSFKSETLVGREVAASEAASQNSASAAEDGVDGVAMPGAHVQFFVAPLSLETQKTMPESKPLDSVAETGAELSTWSIALGAHAGYDGSLPQTGNQTQTGHWDGTGASGVLSGVGGAGTVGGEQVTLIHNHFGAVSSHGIFLAAMGNSQSGANSAESAPATRTKLDTPSAYVWGSMHPR